jgi:hypothetical protein
VRSRLSVSGSGSCACIWWRLRWPVLVLHDVPGIGEPGDDAVGATLGDACPGRDAAQPHAWS